MFRIQSVCLVGFVSVLAVVATIAGPSKTDRTRACESCGNKVFVVPLDHPAAQEMHEKLAAMHESVRREVALRKLEAMFEDRATELAPAADSNGAIRDLQLSLCEHFRKHDPVPAARIEFFSAMTKQTQCVVTGWYGSIRGAVEVPDGCLVELQVRPHLASMKWGVPYTSDSCIETWFLPSEGPMELLNVRGVKGAVAFMSD